MQHFRANHFAAFHFAANQLRGLANAVIGWGATGGIGGHKKRKFKKSHIADVRESLKAVIYGDEADAEIVEQVKQYVKPNKEFKPINIDLSRLLEDVGTVQLLLARYQEYKQEQEDEEILLMLI